MSEAQLIFALPSKGRLHEDAADWLADCGFKLGRRGGSRGYAARLKGLPEAEVRLLSAREIAMGLDVGAIHLGVTGEDLLREVSAEPDARLHLAKSLGFGHADLVVAAPMSWIDVSRMADLDAAGDDLRALGRGQLRVATKYARLTRAFFARHGVSDYRIVESHGATEGAPASGAADVIVDITSTGATLSANHLKILEDGVILRSEAQLCASLVAPWSETAVTAVRTLFDAMEARAAADGLVHIRAFADREAIAAAASQFEGVADPEGGGLLCPSSRGHAAAAFLRDKTGARVVCSPVSAVFEPTNPVFDDLFARITSLAPM